MLSRNTYVYAKAKIGDWLEFSPELWRNIQLYRFRRRPVLKKIVTPSHDLCIEGFPRSANSFAVRAFFLDNERKEITCATHMHCSAQVILAARWNIPTLVLIRRPEKAIVSLLALSSQKGHIDMAEMNEKEKLRWVKYYTCEYTRFYRTIRSQREKFVLADFSETTSDFGQIIRRMNKKFSTNWVEFNHTDESVSRIFNSSKDHLSPSIIRDNIKKSFVEAFFSKENQLARKEAEATYEMMIS